MNLSPETALLLRAALLFLLVLGLERWGKHRHNRIKARRAVICNLNRRHA